MYTNRLGARGPGSCASVRLKRTSTGPSSTSHRLKASAYAWPGVRGAALRERNRMWWSALGALLLSTLCLSAVQGSPTVHAYYFWKARCPACAKPDSIVEKLLENDPQVKLLSLDLYRPADYEMADALLTVAGVPKETLPGAPALLLGDTYLDRDELSEGTVGALLASHRATGTPDLYEKATQIRGHARNTLPLQLRRFGLLPVLGAGLLDAINPCAIATLVFFLSYLGMMGFGKRVTLITGLAFTAGVYVAYFSLGLGLLHALHLLDAFGGVRQVVQGVIAVACLGFAAVTLRDYQRIREGLTAETSLQLPASLRRGTHTLIREGLRARLVVPAALVAGAGVAALELACTGQVYIPAIIYMFSVSATRTDALIWLVLYDIMFVLPLLVLLFLLMKGISSKWLAALARRQMAGTKLAMGLLFVAAGVYFLVLAFPRPAG